VPRSDRTLRLLIGLAFLVLLANIGVLLWLESLPVPQLDRHAEYDLGPGEVPARR
jgi:hypothetical protein